MRFLHRKRRAFPLELPMTSMIDVVFLLIVYFMVSASFAANERELASIIRLQKKGSASELDSAVIDILPESDGWIFRLGGRRIVSPDELAELLQAFENKEEGAFVRVHDDVPFDVAATVIQTCKDSGFTAVAYIPISARNPGGVAP